MSATVFNTPIKLNGPQAFEPVYPASTAIGATNTGIVGTSVTYTDTLAVPFNSLEGMMIIRSNATVAMTDTIPSPTLTRPNGWKMYVHNADASASITISTTNGALINGVSTLVVTAGSTFTIRSDGFNYWH